MGLLNRHNGRDCAELSSQIVVEIVHKIFRKKLKNIANESLNYYNMIVSNLHQVFIELDLKIMQNLKEKSMESGSTAIVVLHIDNNVFCANLGDSRAFIMGKEQSTSLSQPHTLVP